MMRRQPSSCGAVVAGAIFLAGVPAALAGQAVSSIELAKELTIPKLRTVELPFALDAVPKGQQVRLAFDARVNYSSHCANNAAMYLSINGKSVTGAALLNKPLEYTTKNGSDAAWTGGSAWLLFSFPRFSVEEVRRLENGYAIDQTDPFHFVLDVTAHVKTGRNVVSVTHPKITDEGHSLVLRGLRVEIGPPIVRPESGGAPASVVLRTFIPQGRQRVEMEVQVSPSARIRLAVGRNRFDVTSRTSEPDGRWSPALAGDFKGIRQGSSGTVHWRCQEYTVRRTVSVREDHVHVADTFTNTTKALVGVICQHRLAAEPSREPSDVRLAGWRRYAARQAEYSCKHPTALARWGDAAVGLVAEDDVFRVHAKLFAEPGVIGLADEQLGVEPGKSATLEWSIYPVPRGDYWDFVNAVRRNWGCDFTLPGTSPFVDWSSHQQTDEHYRRFVTARGVKSLCCLDAMLDDGKAAMGTAIPLAKRFAARTTAWIAQLHAVAPDVKALVYMNCSLCCEPQAASRYADSRILTEHGRQPTIPCSNALGDVEMVPCFFSHPDHSYGRAMMNVCRQIIEDWKADGLYHDGLVEDFGAWTYGGPWDGCSVIIDPRTHRAAGKRSSVALLQQPWHVMLVSYLRQRGKLFYANGPVGTRTMLGLKIPVFAETCFRYSAALSTHLGSPWAYANHMLPQPSGDYYRDTAQIVRRILDYGAVPAIPSWPQEPHELTFLHLLGPITPLEIREGMVLGRERMLTNRSGCYGWPDGSDLEGYVFDQDGRALPDPPIRKIRQADRRLAEVRLPSEHFAILVKLGAK